MVPGSWFGGLEASLAVAAPMALGGRSHILCLHHQAEAGCVQQQQGCILCLGRRTLCQAVCCSSFSAALNMIGA